MTSSYIKRIVYTAMFAALICIATLVIQIPSPMNGYVNLGDGVILIASWILGPVCGMIAGAVGSGLADVIGGYAYYAPATIVIKGLCGLAAGLLFSKTSTWRCILAAVVAEIIMVLGYFAYAGLIFGEGIGAAASIPGNIAQGVMGIIIFILAMMRFKKMGKNPGDF